VATRRDQELEWTPTRPLPKLSGEYHDALASTTRSLSFGLASLMVALAIATNVFG
jgi:hypothetical protein